MHQSIYSHLTKTHILGTLIFTFVNALMCSDSKKRISLESLKGKKYYFKNPIIE